MRHRNKIVSAGFRGIERQRLLEVLSRLSELPQSQVGAAGKAVSQRALGVQAKNLPACLQGLQVIPGAEVDFGLPRQGVDFMLG